LGGRLVVHYQIGEEAVRRLDKLMRVVLKGEKSGGRAEHDAEDMKLNVE
jgi:threonine aldolase